MFLGMGVSNDDAMHNLLKNELKLFKCLRGNCHARMHGLMHDGRLRACPSYLLGLLYGCKVMNVLK